MDRTIAASGAMRVTRITTLAAILAMGPASRMRGQLGMSISTVLERRRRLRITAIESSETISSIGVAVAMAMAARCGWSGLAAPPPEMTPATGLLGEANAPVSKMVR